MSNSKYNETNVIRSLSRNRSINVNYHDKTIHVETDATSIGNKTLGKIDYLVNYCGYVVLHVNHVNKQFRGNFDNEDISNQMIASKRDKVNMVTMVKNTMKRNKR